MKRKVTGTMRVNAYEVLRRAVEEGAARGVRRAHKHDDLPSKDAIAEQVVHEVLVAVSEVFDFGDSP